MNIVDAVIILIILTFGVLGLKRGFFKQTVIAVGMILVFILAFTLKNPVAEFLSLNLPFFEFFGAFKGITVINIIMYQLLAFLIVLTVLGIIFKILIKITGVFEKILNFTIILGIPSKILGFIVGIVEGYVVVFIIAFLLSQPSINFKIIDESKYIPQILDKSPGLSNVVENMNTAIKNIYSLKDKYNNTDNNGFNLEAVDVLLKEKIVKVDLVEKLVDKEKINILGIENILNKYR